MKKIINLNLNEENQKDFEIELNMLIEKFQKKEGFSFKGVGVDLGLPSGNIWAKVNVGATDKDMYGKMLTFEEAQKINFSDDWSMPSDKDFQELYDNCNHLWVTIGDVNGELFISKKNGNYVFFPAAGFCSITKLYNRGTDGYYWSSLLISTVLASNLYFNSSSVEPHNRSYHHYEFSVRAVQHLKK